MPGMEPGTPETTGNETDVVPTLTKLTFLWGRQTPNTQINIQLGNVKVTRGYETTRGNVIWKIREGFSEKVTFELTSEGEVGGEQGKRKGKRDSS